MDDRVADTMRVDAHENNESVHGSFDSVTLAIRPRLEIASEWLIAADKVSYRITPDGVIVLTVIPSARNITVKIEPEENAISISEEDLTGYAVSATPTVSTCPTASAAAPTASSDLTAVNAPIGPAVSSDATASTATSSKVPAEKRSHRGRAMCSIEDCTNEAYKRVLMEDNYGKAGHRCRKHGALDSIRVRCTVDGCAAVACDGQRCRAHPSGQHAKMRGKGGRRYKIRIATKPRAGGKGPAELTHIASGRHCNVVGCSKMTRRRVMQADQFGVAGPRCMRHGAVSQRCTVLGCARKAVTSVVVGDRFGSRGLRCKSHILAQSGGARPSSAHCNVEGCPKVTHGSVLSEDQFGLPGPRCHTHDGIFQSCMVPGCTEGALKNVEESDCFGHPGRRCERHVISSNCVQEFILHPNAGRVLRRATPGCSVDGCPSVAHGKVQHSDEFGCAGLRCRTHGAISRRCVVAGCTNKSFGMVTENDQYGPSGRRCTRHGGTSPRCSVLGCTHKAISNVTENDLFGLAGLRCKIHIASSSVVSRLTPQVPQSSRSRHIYSGVVSRQCSVDECLKKSFGKVTQSDQFGVAGRRCMRHGGASQRCTVLGCDNKALWVAAEEDQWGPAGHRCKWHFTPDASLPAVPKPRAKRVRTDVENRRCNVAGCHRVSRGKVVECDEFGQAGNRCLAHGVHSWRCVVEGCTNTSRGIITQNDEFGPAGPRCYRHRRSYQVREHADAPSMGA